MIRLRILKFILIASLAVACAGSLLFIVYARQLAEFPTCNF